MLDLSRQPAQPLIAASILSADFGHMIAECRDVLDKGADLLHVDVMDGHFVGNLTMGQDMIRALRRHLPDVYLDVHLMVERPGDYIDSFAQAGANMFTFHLEVCGEGKNDGRALIERIRQAGMSPGLAINPPTPPDGLIEYLTRVDLMLVMSVNPGRSGQSFMPEVLSKVTWLKQRVEPRVRLEIDGGINARTASAAAAAADVLVTASALFGAADRAAAIQQMRRGGGH